MRPPIEGGGTITQRFGIPASMVTSLEPAMWHDSGRKAYWLWFPGAVFSYHYHPGTDRAALAGTPIFAKEDGIVTFAGYKNNIDGYQVEVAINDHAGYSTNHMLSQIKARVGQHVTRGATVMGYVGCTGSCTGNHTHEGVYIREKGSDGIERTMLYDPQLFEGNGPLVNDPRVRPDVRKFHVNGAGINIRYAPPNPSDGRSNVFAISREDGIYRRSDGKKIAGLHYGFTFLRRWTADGITFKVGTGPGGRRIAVADDLSHF